MHPTLDTLIIGAGTAGLAALREVRKRTDNFLIVNEGPWGTTCARVGCMPSKMLVEAANALHARTRWEAFGLRDGQDARADLPAVLTRLRTLRDEFVAGTIRASDAGERSVSGRARLLDAQRVEVNGRTYKTRSVIVATGSRPVLPPDWLAFGERILTSDNLFEQPTLGPRMAVIGLGAIGTELAQALARLGVEVVAFVTRERVAGLTDESVNAALLEQLKGEFAISVGERAQLRELASGIEVSNGSTTVVVDQVLAAMGRTPNVEYLGLDTLGPVLDKHGLPPVDPCTLQVGDTAVFLAGDADRDRALLHEAADEGHMAGINAMLAAQGKTLRHFRRRVPLAITFSDPQAASVGMPWAEVRKQKPLVGEVDYGAQGRARVALRNAGLLRIYAAPGTGRLLGAQLCAPSGEHLAQLLALAIDRDLTVQDLLRMPFYHPTLEEGLRTALRQIARQLESSSDSDLSDCENLGASALD
ncbi:dihydrolipoyl dehydrogenase [Pulveribacter suum]|uniref:Dihydrolipoyl dehydrogenase n=1 Tax=Pulveribacter suum TaxID=2116657 RepID=A0A2P1NLS3_9BURK|nr:dihydrolipoyl dehydrogenase [Pulveribacter suum]AVP58014.1 dihydrolipoyl dehydrogenase [Pulveribacter suum]